MANQGENQNSFDEIMGDCAGVNIMELTPDDIRHQAQEWEEIGEPCDEEEIERAIKGLREYQTIARV